MEKNYLIGGVRWKVRADIDINGFLYDSFIGFENYNSHPDVTHNYSCIEKHSVYKVSKCEIRDLLSNKKLKKIGDPENRLLGYKLIFDYLNKNIHKASYLAIEIQKPSITFMDFKERKINTFYTIKHQELLKESKTAPFTIANFMHHFNALFVHSSAVIIENKAALFIAPDEGGKTTIAEILHKKYPIITDDQNVIRKEGDKYYCYGTPWGVYITNKSTKVKLGGIFLLEKSDKFKLTPLNSNFIFAFLCREHYANFTYLRDDGRKKYFGLLSDICNKFPAYKLQFSKDYIDPDAIAAVMKE